MDNHTHLIIIGAGIIGLTTAIAMRERGFSVCLVDAAPIQPTESNAHVRMYAINRASQDLFTTLGVWDYIEPSEQSIYRQMHVWDACNSAHIDFDARMIGTNQLGMILAEETIKRALLKRLSTLDSIHLIQDYCVAAVDSNPEFIAITSTEGTSRTSDLLIIADGAHSSTRELLKVPITTWPYHQHAIVATVHTNKPHGQTAYQIFNPDGPLAFLPLVDPHQCSIVWSSTSRHAKTNMSLEKDAFSAAISQAFEYTLGECTLVSDRHIFPLHMRHAAQYTGPRWLLMGDAAHTIHPLAGLGLNLSLADLRTWLSTVDGNPKQWCAPKTLSAYQRESKQAVWKAIACIGALKSLFANPLPPIAALRGLGLNLTNRCGPLKRLLIAEAMG
jgi:2-octaprenylphenol hydroxylase